MNTRFPRLICGALLPLALLTACAAVTPSTPEEAVAKRAQARFDALVARDFKAAYGFFTPSYRDRVDYENWIRSRLPRASFRSARVLKVECPSADACEVEMETAYDSPRGVKAAPKGLVERVVPERWVRVEGEWWLFQAR